MSSRRNSVIRSVVAITGDIAFGASLAVACVWIIESAALGLFLSFMVWLLAALLSLALSQYVVHPVVRLVLADDKLDRGLDAAVSLAAAVVRVSSNTRERLWSKFVKESAAQPCVA